VIKELIIGFLVICVIISTGYLVIIDYQKDWINNCDNIYGKNNWTTNETTGIGHCKFYIGQCWDCVVK
jgi:hypothetical protein